MNELCWSVLLNVLEVVKWIYVEVFLVFPYHPLMSSRLVMVQVSVCSCCCNKMLQRGWLINHRNFSLTVWRLEVPDHGAGRCDVMAGDGPLPGLQPMPSRCTLLQGWMQGRIHLEPLL